MIKEAIFGQKRWTPPIKAKVIYYIGTAKIVPTHVPNLENAFAKHGKFGFFIS